MDIVNKVRATSLMYDLLAKDYDGRYLGEKFQAENRQVFEWIREGRGGKIGAPRVLDLGAGTGLTLDIGVLDDGDFQDYVAVDPSAGMLEQLRMKYPEVSRVFPRTAEDFLEQNPNEIAEIVVSLFGSPSHMLPETITALPGRCIEALVLMHYAEGYFPYFYDETVIPNWSEKSREAALALLEKYPGRVEHLGTFQVVLIGENYV